MGIMPSDRDQKWQRVFRRFGLPGESIEPDRESKDRSDSGREPVEPAPRAMPRQPKDSSKRG
jgi:hypothetical protein